MEITQVSKLKWCFAESVPDRTRSLHESIYIRYPKFGTQILSYLPAARLRLPKYAYKDASPEVFTLLQNLGFHAREMVSSARVSVPSNKEVG